MPFFTAYKALILRAGTRPGETVLGKIALSLRKLQLEYRRSVKKLVHVVACHMFAFKSSLCESATSPVHGASGAVGTAAVQIARALGAVVVGTAGTKEGMDVVTKVGIIDWIISNRF